MILNSQQDCSFYTHQSYPYYPRPIIPPYTICMCPYCTPYPIYALYAAAYHPYIPSFGSLYSPLHSFLPSSIYPNLLTPGFIPHLSSRITYHIKNRSNCWSRIFYRDRGGSRRIREAHSYQIQAEVFDVIAPNNNLVIDFFQHSVCYNVI